MVWAKTQLMGKSSSVVLQGETWLARHAHVLQAVAAAKSGGDMAKALLFVERMMVEQDMVQPHWAGHFQAAWRKGLAKCIDSRQVIMYLAALQVCPVLLIQAVKSILPHAHRDLVLLLLLSLALRRTLVQLHCAVGSDRGAAS